MGRARAIVTVGLALGAMAVGACRGGGPAPAPPSSTGPAPASSAPTTAAEGFGPPELLGQVDDPAVAESSGLAASRRNPGLLWTHNDSGDEPRIYCLTAGGARCGTWDVTGASARDWEDMAAGPGPVAGTSYLYLGDIGDNNRNQPQVVVYRVAEPAAPAPAPAPGRAATAPAERIVLRYEDGPHDAEALLVHPTTGDLYVVTKAVSGAAVYKAAAGTGVLRRIAGFGLGIGELVTGGDIAPDGRRVAICTYYQAYELTLPAGAGFDDVWDQDRRPLALAARAQGEAIAYRLDGRALLTTSERSPFPLHQVVRR
ncbi:MAG: hypothetical protein ACT4PX_07165 [Actinomycetota bacterium]